jgi:hypothetical protein
MKREREEGSTKEGDVVQSNATKKILATRLPSILQNLHVVLSLLRPLDRLRREPSQKVPQLFELIETLDVASSLPLVLARSVAEHISTFCGSGKGPLDILVGLDKFLEIEGKWGVKTMDERYNSNYSYNYVFRHSTAAINPATISEDWHDYRLYFKVVLIENEWEVLYKNEEGRWCIVGKSASEPPSEELYELWGMLYAHKDENVYLYTDEVQDMPILRPQPDADIVKHPTPEREKGEVILLFSHDFDSVRSEIKHYFSDIRCGNLLLPENIASNLKDKSYMIGFIRDLLKKLYEQSNQIVDNLQNLEVEPCDTEATILACLLLRKRYSVEKKPRKRTWIPLLDSHKNKFCRLIHLKDFNSVSQYPVPGPNELSTVYDLWIVEVDDTVHVMLKCCEDNDVDCIRRWLLRSNKPVERIITVYVLFQGTTDNNNPDTIEYNLFIDSTIRVFRKTVEYDLKARGIEFESLGLRMQGCPIGDIIDSVTQTKTTLRYLLSELDDMEVETITLEAVLKNPTYPEPSHEPVMVPIALKSTTIHPNQIRMAQELKQRVQKILGKDSEFQGINILVTVPPRLTLQRQTQKRFVDAGLRYDPNRQYVSLIQVGDEYLVEQNAFFESVEKNPTILHVLIDDECHWGITKNGPHNKIINQRCPGAKNLIRLLVSATPENVLSKHSRVNPDNVIHWKDEAKEGEKVYCHLDHYIARMEDEDAPISADPEFEKLVIPLTAPDSQPDRSLVLLIDYAISVCYYSQLLKLENNQFVRKDPTEEDFVQMAIEPRNLQR